MTGKKGLWVDTPIDLPGTSFRRCESFLTFIKTDEAAPSLSGEGE